MGHRWGGALGVLAFVAVLSCSSEDEEPPPPKVYRPKLVDVAIGKHYRSGGPFAVAISDDGCSQSSENFADWTAGGNAFSGPPLRSITYAKDVFFWGGAGFHFELCPASLSSCIDSGINGDTKGYHAVAICPGFGYFLAGDDGFLATFSGPGKSFTFPSGPTKSEVIVGVACDSTRVVLVTKSDTAYAGALSATTLDKVTGTGMACGLALGNGLFLEARVDGTIETSTDGKTWTVTATAQWSATDDCDVAFGGGTFVISIGNGDVFTSGDGKTWTKFDYGGSAKINGVGVSEDGKLLAVGDDGVAIEATCSAGTCSDPKRHEVLVEALGRPREVEQGSSSGGSSGGSCDGCTTDADCNGVAQRNGIAGAACSGGLCYPCKPTCSQGGVNCRCISCGEAGGCGDAECLGTICAYKRDGKKPCE